MADEIQLTIGMMRRDGTDIKHLIPVRNITITQAVKRHNSLTKAVGTTEESVDFSTFDITTNGYMLIENNDATNFIEWGVATTVYTGKILPGETAGPFQLSPGKTLYLKANTAACDTEITMYAL